MTISNWVQIGRFATGADTAANGGEYQRADCAPKEMRGNGVISISDWVQAGRYAAGLDEVVAAGGPTAPSSLLPEISGELAANGEQLANRVAQARSVRAAIVGGMSGTITLMLNAQGDENALGFSLLFNPSQWRFISAANGSDASDALLNTNTLQTSRGRLGVALALPANRVFTAGARQLVVLTFEPVAGGSAAPPLALSFGDAPVSREVVAVDARTLAASYAVELSGSTLSLLTSVSAASFRGGDLAREQIIAAFGANLATQIAIADTLPLPTELAGTRVVFTDSRGVTRNAPLFFVSPTQINYQLPAETADGAATVTVTRGGNDFSIGIAFIGAVAPALFTADASGTGLPAATLLRVSATGVLSYEPISRFDTSTNRIVAVPINLGAETDQVFLVLYGTGVRGRSNLPNVSCTAGGVAAEVTYAGEASGFVGLDQLNLRLPASLRGRGTVNVFVSVDGKSANGVTINVK